MNTTTTKPSVATTWLPLFEGFYSTIFEFNESDYLYENDLKYDDIEVDYESYQNDVAKAYCKSVAEHLSDYVNSIEFERVVSPKYYNYRNDSVNIIVDYKALEVQRYCIDNFEALNNYTKLQYTSCDGFISHYPNSAEGWQELTNNFIDFSDAHTLGAILQFIVYEMMRSEGYNIKNSIENDVFESIDSWSYISQKQSESEPE